MYFHFVRFYTCKSLQFLKGKYSITWCTVWWLGYIALKYD